MLTNRELWGIRLWEWLLAAAYVVWAILSPATYDQGDSLTHYLAARWAPHHPFLYLDHWFKPLFTLLSSPFAYLGGFAGIRVFNLLCIWGASVASARAGQRLQLRYAHLFPLLFLFAPLFLQVGQSGLTEPLLLLFVSVAFWAFVAGRWWLVALLCAFMPYIRSEGLVFQLAFAGAVVLAGSWRYLPLFLAGYVVYGALGWLLQGRSFWWYFVENPYDGSALHKYGTGELFYYFDKIPFVLGLPLTVLFALGLVHLFIGFVRGLVGHRPANWAAQYVLLPMLGLSMVAVHTVFWYTGGFNSFGLIRVLLPAASAMMLIALVGAEWGARLCARRAAGMLRVWWGLWGVYVLVFPFTPNHYAYHWQTDFGPPHRRML